MSASKQSEPFLLTEEPKKLTCKEGHDLGVWSYEGETKQVCKICVDVSFPLHIRKRHDITTPKGRPIIVEGTKDENKAMFDHFAEHHPEMLLKSGMVKFS